MISASIEDVLPSRSQVSYFRRELINWFKVNGRSFPWRDTRDPYKVLIAESMLRRTRAEQVKGIYEEAITRYPSLQEMATASVHEISRLFVSLGLNWRIQPFCTMVREIEAKYNCRIPENRDQLKQLPGIGDYVAGAVLSFAFNKREWIIDTNVARVFKRYFDIETSGEVRRDKKTIELARMYVSSRNPRDANLAILDFAALICTARNPRHELCPLKKRCHSEMSQSTGQR